MKKPPPHITVKLVIAFMAILLAPQIASADASRGAEVAKRQCGSCHSIGGSGSMTPSFREIAQKYQDDDMQDSIIEGMASGHSNLGYIPDLSSDEIEDLASLLNRLARRH